MIVSKPTSRLTTPTNIGLQVLAVFLSIFLWAFVRFTQTPFSATISQAEVLVPLEVVTDDEMAAIEAPPTVSVTVRGSQDAIQGLKQNAVAASVDLRGKTEGLLFPKVTVSPPPDLNVVSVEPERLSIRLVPVVTQSFTVEAKLSGHVAQGYSASAPVLRTATVNVKGPRPYVQQVKSVNAVIALNNTETGIMQRVLLEPRDEDGNLVRNVEVSPNTEIVTVNVSPAVVPRLLPVFPSFTGALPRDNVMTTTWSPRIVPLVSPKGTTTPPTAIFTRPIDLSRLEAGEHRLTAELDAPTGATLVKEREIQVVVKVQSSKKADTPENAKSGPPQAP